MSNTQEAKIALLSYCRFARQMHYVATEVSMPGDSLADVVASDGNNLIEYEVKISMSDLKGDNKKCKHLIYDPTPITWDGDIATKKKLKILLKKNDLDQWRGQFQFRYVDKPDTIYSWVSFHTREEAVEWLEKTIGTKSNCPNMLYYVVPRSLWDKYQEKIVESLETPYGVIVFNGTNYHEMEVVKKATKLHKNKVSDETLRTIVARMSSELAGLTNTYYNYTKNITEYGSMIEKRFSLNEEVEDGR